MIREMMMMVVIMVWWVVVIEFMITMITMGRPINAHTIHDNHDFLCFHNLQRSIIFFLANQCKVELLYARFL